MLVSNAVISSP